MKKSSKEINLMETKIREELQSKFSGFTNLIIYPKDNDLYMDIRFCITNDRLYNKDRRIKLYKIKKHMIQSFLHPDISSDYYILQKRPYDLLKSILFKYGFKDMTKRTAYYNPNVTIIPYNHRINTSEFLGKLITLTFSDRKGEYKWKWVPDKEDPTDITNLYPLEEVEDHE